MNYIYFEIECSFIIIEILKPECYIKYKKANIMMTRWNSPEKRPARQYYGIQRSEPSFSDNGNVYVFKK